MKKFLSAFFVVGSIALVGMADPTPPQVLQVVPATFDFGWCPDNAKISADFAVKNVGTDVLPLTAVQPTCGCTASHFTPENLASNAEAKVGLTFNTRGYTNTEFHKTAKVKTDKSDVEYTVQLTGHVTDPEAKVVPVGDGIASFEPGTKEKTKKIEIANKSDKDVSLEIVQNAADWAKVKLLENAIKPGKTANLEITVAPPYEHMNDTSLTLAANDGAMTHRLTIAIRTGELPAPYRINPAPPAPVKKAPAPTKKTPAKK